MSQAQPAEQVATVEILLACPNCGAPFAVDDEAVNVTCRHCGSLLVLTAPDREEIYLADGRIEDEHDALEIIIEYRLRARRVEIASALRDPEGNSGPEWIISNRVKAFEKELRAQARLLVAQVLQVPYWHITGKIVQGILGRVNMDIKVTRIRAFGVEHTVPAYETSRFNLRDRGLRMAQSRVRPLTAADAERFQRFLKWVSLPEQSYRAIDKWLRRRLDQKIEAMYKHGRFLFPRRMLVYRPYWLVRARTDETTRWVLMDGQFRTIAGYPDDAEIASFRDGCIASPLDTEGESFLNVVTSKSRCPECAWEGHFDRRSIAAICPNCHRALIPAPGGLETLPYDHSPARGIAEPCYVPFWRFAFRATPPDGDAVETLDEWLEMAFPAGRPPRFEPSGRHLWVPAVKLIGSAVGDQALKDLTAWIHGAALDVVERKVPHDARSSFMDVSVSEEQARELARFTLLGLHNKPSAARLNVLLVRRTCLDLELELSEPRLVLVPFGREEGGLRRDDVSVPQLLLEGGPSLEAQRMTVHDILRKAQ